MCFEWICREDRMAEVSLLSGRQGTPLQDIQHATSRHSVRLCRTFDTPLLYIWHTPAGFRHAIAENLARHWRPFGTPLQDTLHSCAEHLGRDCRAWGTPLQNTWHTTAGYVALLCRILNTPLQNVCRATTGQEARHCRTWGTPLQDMYKQQSPYEWHYTNTPRRRGNYSCQSVPTERG
jgi:hypothetical protein